MCADASAQTAASNTSNTYVTTMQSCMSQPCMCQRCMHTCPWAPASLSECMPTLSQQTCSYVCVGTDRCTNGAQHTFSFWDDTPRTKLGKATATAGHGESPVTNHAPPFGRHKRQAPLARTHPARCTRSLHDAAVTKNSPVSGLLATSRTQNKKVLQGCIGCPDQGVAWPGELASQSVQAISVVPNQGGVKVLREVILQAMLWRLTNH